MSVTVNEFHQSARKTLRLQLGTAFFAFILIGATEAAVGVLLPSIGKQYGLDKSTVSLIFLAGSTGYLTAAFSSGLLVEKLGARLLLMLGAGVLLTGASIISLTPPFGVLVGAWLLLGFGIATLDASLNSYIAAMPNNGALLNYLHAFYGVGALLGPLIASSFLAFDWAWNSVYFLWIAISLLLIASFSLFYERRIPEPVSHSQQAEKAQGNVLALALKLPVVWLAALFLLFYVGAEVSLGNWSYSFLTEERREATLFSGWMVSGYWLGLTIGRLTLANVVKKVGARRLIEGCLAGVVLGVVLFWLVPVGAVSALALILIGFSLGPIFPTTIALMPDLVPARLLASAIGFLASLASVGAALFPWLVGNLAQGYGLWVLMPYVIALTVVMLLFWFALQRRSSKV